MQLHHETRHMQFQQDNSRFSTDMVEQLNHVSTRTLTSGLVWWLFESHCWLGLRSYRYKIKEQKSSSLGETTRHFSDGICPTPPTTVISFRSTQKLYLKSVFMLAALNDVWRLVVCDNSKSSKLVITWLLEWLQSVKMADKTFSCDSVASLLWST